MGASADGHEWGISRAHTYLMLNTNHREPLHLGARRRQQWFGNRIEIPARSEYLRLTSKIRESFKKRPAPPFSVSVVIEQVTIFPLSSGAG